MKLKIVNKKYFISAFILTFLISYTANFYAYGEANISPPAKKKLAFVTKRSSLWYKHSKDLKEKNLKKEETAQVFLEGELYLKSKKVNEVSKKNLDRSTPEGLVASYFSASENGDVDWIAENFVDSEKSKILELFKDKKALKASQENVKKIQAKFIKGEAKYKEHLLLFIEEQYPKNIKVTETIACRKTTDGWKLTNSLSTDETFDIVFAAVSSGQVTEVKQLTLN